MFGLQQLFGFHLNGDRIDLSGVRMQFNDIKGKCPVCGQGVAGYISQFEGAGTDETTMVKCNNGHWQPLNAWNREVEQVKAEPPAETATMLQNPPPEIDPLAPIDLNARLSASRSALELLRADWNPDKNHRVGQLKFIVAALVTECEKLRDRKRLPEQLSDGTPNVPNREYNAQATRGARNAANAITAFETAMMHLEKAIRAVKDV